MSYCRRVSRLDENLVRQDTTALAASWRPPWTYDVAVVLARGIGHGRAAHAPGRARARPGPLDVMMHDMTDARCMYHGIGLSLIHI